jgi:hypothetical protein
MRLREYLDTTGTKVSALAVTLGVAETTIYRWMSGRRRPNFEQMRAVCAASLGAVTPNDWVLI